MADKYLNKYRIPSARLENWDYSNRGSYFITICTKNRKHFFGEIINGKMHLSDLGKIAHKYWMEIPLYFPFVKLGVMVIMPNHMHGIIIIIKKSNNDVARRDAIYRVCLEDRHFDEIVRCEGDAINRVCTDDISIDKADNIPREIQDNIPNKMPGGITGNNNPMLSDSISKILRWYKGRVSFESRKIHAQFAWQSRFHDHIIRNSKSFYRIQEYIINNPNNWLKDKFSK